jgi:hypothetical protein
MKKGKLIGLIFIVAIIGLILNSIQLVFADSIIYTQAQIQFAGAGLPSNGYEFYATVATATKICELKNPSHPIVESFGRPSSVVAKNQILGHNINSWDTSINNWTLIDYKINFCIRKPILRTLTCRSNNTGEISRLTDPNRIVINRNQLILSYMASLGISYINRTDTEFGSEIETAKKICNDLGYLDVIDFELSAFCNGGDWVDYFINATNTWTTLHYNVAVNSTSLGYIYPTLICKTCQPKTCANIINGGNAECGNYQDGCGGQITCGGCTMAQECNSTIGRCYDLPVIPPACNAFHTLFRISVLDNATVLLYNDTNPGYNVCYGDIFNVPYTGTNPHVCTPLNVIFWLNQSNYSEVSTERRAIFSPADFNYDFRVNNEDRLIFLSKFTPSGSIVLEATTCDAGNDWCNYTDFNKDGITNKIDFDYFVNESYFKYDIDGNGTIDSTEHNYFVNETNLCLNADPNYAWAIINWLNNHTILLVNDTNLYGNAGDINRDGFVSPIDALRLINLLNSCDMTGGVDINSDNIGNFSNVTFGSIYNTPVCYGDLRCTTQLTDCVEATDGSLVGYLDYNISGRFQPPTYTGGEFPIRICCRPDVVVTGAGTAHWATFTNSTDTLNLTHIGNSVVLVFNKPGLQDEMILYEIYKEGSFGWNFFDWFDRKVLQITGRGFTTWTTDQVGDFKFKATIISTGQSLESNTLEVFQPSINDPPTVILINPRKENNFTIGLTSNTGEINFIHESYDNGDLLNITWNFGDGNITTYTDHAQDVPGWQRGEVTHTYTTPGAKKITVTATEEERGQYAEASIIIYIYQVGLSMQTRIDSPDENASGPGIFFVSGNRTFVSNCTRSGATSLIVQTACNDDQYYKFSNGYISDHGKCFQNFENDNLMWCYKYASVFVGNPPVSDTNRNRFNFTWFFDNEVESNFTNGDTFYHTFLTLNKHQINLRTGYRIS